MFLLGNLTMFILRSASFCSPTKLFPSSKNPASRFRPSAMAAAVSGFWVRMAISGASGKSHSKGISAGTLQRVFNREASFFQAMAVV